MPARSTLLSARSRRFDSRLGGSGVRFGDWGVRTPAINSIARSRSVWWDPLELSSLAPLEDSLLIVRWSSDSSRAVLFRRSASFLALLRCLKLKISPTSAVAKMASGTTMATVDGLLSAEVLIRALLVVAEADRAALDADPVAAVRVPLLDALEFAAKVPKALEPPRDDVSDSVYSILDMNLLIVLEGTPLLPLLLACALLRSLSPGIVGEVPEPDESGEEPGESDEEPGTDEDVPDKEPAADGSDDTTAPCEHFADRAST